MTAALEAVIGLEVHVQLATRTKMFCSCENRFGAEPNTLTCPVCLGRPGALPVPNRRAFELGVRLGCALGATIARHTDFDRKQYFYPDQPKGYQISQFDRPLLEDLALPLETGRTIGIVRAHLEEDAGKAIHEPEGRGSLIDLNRCGVPLLEIVSAPEITSPDEAVEYLTRLKLLLRHLRISDCDMEKGSLRCDVNVSLRPAGTTPLGVRVEIKNLNSFRSVKASLEHEIERQGAILAAGREVEHETRLWDEERSITRTMRTKEESRDYRYFPDPDLPPCHLEASWIESMRASLEELPWRRRDRWRDELGLSDYDSEVLIQDPGVADYFDRTCAAGVSPKAAATWITGEIFSLMKTGDRTLEDGHLSPEGLARVIALVEDDTLNVASGRKLVGALFAEGGDPDAVIERLGLRQLSDAAELAERLEEAIAAHPRAVAEIRGGKAKARGALIGYVMKETRGRADPAVLNRLLDERFPPA